MFYDYIKCTVISLFWLNKNCNHIQKEKNNKSLLCTVVLKCELQNIKYPMRSQLIFKIISFDEKRNLKHIRF